MVILFFKALYRGWVSGYYTFERVFIKRERERSSHVLLLASSKGKLEMMSLTVEQLSDWLTWRAIGLERTVEFDFLHILKVQFENPFRMESYDENLMKEIQKIFESRK